jgi:membrane associated rhomboid family serine protease
MGEYTMFPLRDTNPSNTKPFVNWIIIGINAVIFLFEVSLSDEGLNRLIGILGVTPRALLQNPALESLTLFSSMFLHGGWMHLISNMWILFIFGDNIEDRMGRFRYLAFYLLCGVVAALTQVFTAPLSMVPMIGASGAISGISGAYILLFPRARVLTLVPIFFFFTFIEIPALIYLGFWFLLQLFNGLFALSFMGRLGSMGGVAWWAHIGGFVAGLVLVKVFERRRARYGRDYRW